jgi:two-component system chemotaxis response regulator CheY
MVRLDPTFSVLILDPKETATPVLKRMLGEIGIVQIESVSNPVDGLARLREVKPDILLTEWQMEPMSGDELLRTVRSDPTLAELSVLVVTTDPEPKLFFEAMDAGVNAYAIAPFSTQVLASKLEALKFNR